MSKWKCEICNTEFENFEARGFNHTIYCPLCYYKELYKRQQEVLDKIKEIINNVISNGEVIDQLRKIEVKEILELLEEIK